MPKGVRFKYMREEEFDRVKLLIRGGLSNKEIGNALTRSQSTIAKVREAPDFAEYRRRNLEVSRKYRESKAPTPQFSFEDSPKEAEEATETGRTLGRIHAEEVRKLLTSIDTHLEFICENMVVRHKRKAWHRNASE